MAPSLPLPLRPTPAAVLPCCMARAFRSLPANDSGIRTRHSRESARAERRSRAPVLNPPSLLFFPLPFRPPSARPKQPVAGLAFACRATHACQGPPTKTNALQKSSFHVGLTCSLATRSQYRDRPQAFLLPKGPFPSPAPFLPLFPSFPVSWHVRSDGCLPTTRASELDTAGRAPGPSASSEPPFPALLSSPLPSPFRQPKATDRRLCLRMSRDS